MSKNNSLSNPRAGEPVDRVVHVGGGALSPESCASGFYKNSKLHGAPVGHDIWLCTYVTLLILEHRRHRSSSGSPRCPHFGLGSLGLSVQAITTIPIKVMLQDFDEGLGTG